MKAAWILLIFGIILIGFGFELGLESNRPTSPMSFSSGPNFAGIMGFSLLLFGILVSIVAGIIIEWGRTKK